MPLYKESRTNEEGRIIVCFYEHILADKKCMRCKGYYEKIMFPDNLKINPHPKRSKSRKNRK